MAFTLGKGWEKGPLPKGTYYWGGVVLRSDVKEGESPVGFNFADFKGDHVELVGGDSKRVEADEIAYFNNCLVLPDAKWGDKGDL